MLGINPRGDAGWLPPRATWFRVPIYFLGIGGEIEFTLDILSASGAPIDWAAVEADARPDDADPDTWPAMWQKLTGQIGTTWGDLCSP